MFTFLNQPFWAQVRYFESQSILLNLKFFQSFIVSQKSTTIFKEPFFSPSPRRRSSIGRRGSMAGPPLHTGSVISETDLCWFVHTQIEFQHRLIYSDF